MGQRLTVLRQSLTFGGTKPDLFQAKPDRWGANPDLFEAKLLVSGAKLLVSGAKLLDSGAKAFVVVSMVQESKQNKIDTAIYFKYQFNTALSVSSNPIAGFEP